jgi:hypothetical protein
MDEKALALRARVIYSPVSVVKKEEFVSALRAEFRRGEYDVLHATMTLSAQSICLLRRVCRSVGGRSCA